MYTWKGMKKLSASEVYHKWKDNGLVGLYKLYDDGTESMIEEPLTAEEALALASFCEVGEEAKKRYRVFATMTTKVCIDVEAYSPEEAYEIYENTDGKNFTEIISDGRWEYFGMCDLETGKYVNPFEEEEE